MKMERKVLDLADYESKARSAVRMFWSDKKTGARPSDLRRNPKTSAKNMNGFCDLLVAIVHANGLPDAKIKLERGLNTLPGHFYSISSWDLLVEHHGKLIAAIAVESHVGASIAKNMRSSCEQALSRAIEFQAAYRNGTFGEIIKPFVGYLILLEDAPASRTPVKDISPSFPLLSEFRDASYADRYNILCEKLMAERLYTAATVILSSRSASKSGAYSEMSDMTGLKAFVTTLAGHIAAEAAM